jgi:hypothetical protein
MYGGYEKQLRKKIAHQTLRSDWICFTDNKEIRPVYPWQIDYTPYHITHPSYMDDGKMRNSLLNNYHPFNIAKYYKQQFYLIPRLKKYDIIVWLDATIEVKWPRTSQWLYNKVVGEKRSIVGWVQAHRGGSLGKEAAMSMMEDPNTLSKYGTLFWLGHRQPYQNVTQQYLDYVQEGYRDNFWKEYRYLVNTTASNDFGVWCTCFVAFDNMCGTIRHFLDYWYLETLRHTTQDQVSFPYVLQKLSLVPYTLPDKEIWGESPSDVTQFYWKYPHGV